MFGKLKQFLEEISSEIFIYNQLMEEDSEWEEELLETGLNEEYVQDPGYNGKGNSQEIME